MKNNYNASSLSIELNSFIFIFVIVVVVAVFREWNAFVLRTRVVFFSLIPETCEAFVFGERRRYGFT